MSDIRIRPADPEDVTAIRELGRAAWHAAYDDIMGPAVVDERIDDWWRADDLREAVVTPAHTFLVAESADDLVGIVHAGPHPEADCQVVPRLYVRPDRWGQGIGTALLDRVIERADPGVDRFRVVVLEGNDVGVSFYESYGFERLEEETGLTDAGERELVYELRTDE